MASQEIDLIALEAEFAAEQASADAAYAKAEQAVTKLYICAKDQFEAGNTEYRSLSDALWSAFDDFCDGTADGITVDPKTASTATSIFSNLLDADGIE